ncbi:MAG: phage tail protein [Verrucomicrobiota bacterium]|nr:phage tail protein [Verrucomicrobiota bacterium]
MPGFEQAEYNGVLDGEGGTSPSPNIQMQLGEYKFSVSTAAYQVLERIREYRWPKQERLGGMPARQFVGRGDDTISLHGVIFPFSNQRSGSRGSGLYQVGSMATLAGRGEPLELVDSTGLAWGRWCIERIVETKRELAGGGIPKKIEFTISLGFYAEE